MTSPAPISPRELSIVFQGPVYNTPTGQGPSITWTALESARRHFPDAEIILSTWEGSNLNGLVADRIILSKDPGSFLRDEKRGYYHNVNRQIISSRAGLDAATRHYAIKTRTDVIFTHPGCLSFFERFPNRSESYRFTQKRVLVASVTSVNPRRALKLPFHPCDWLFAGLREDVYDIFDIPLFPEPEFTHWFKDRPIPELHPDHSSLARYAAETYIWLYYCKKFITIECDHLCDIDNGNIDLSEKIIANNLMILKPSQLGILSLKNKFSNRSFHSMYTFGDWKRLYNQHCCGGLILWPDLDKARYAFSIAAFLLMRPAEFKQWILRESATFLKRSL